MFTKLFQIFIGILLIVVSFVPSWAGENQPWPFVCGTLSPQEEDSLIREAVARGELPVYNPWPVPPPAKFAPNSHDVITPKLPVTAADLFLFEDAAGILVNPYTDGQLKALMTSAANALIARDGDQWDFIVFFNSFVSDPTYFPAAFAFYSSIKNDVTGIGDFGIFDTHALLGLSGTKVQGFVEMFDIPNGWDGDSSDFADATHLILGQELEHRWAMRLFDTDNGVQLQGDDAGCGRNHHWNFKIDLQGSCMEANEWVGPGPTSLNDSLSPRIFLDFGFNHDNGGLYSFTDLYLMGYVSPAEMDSGNSQSRSMRTSCTSPYAGVIDTFSSANIIATNGTRSPGAASAQHSFRAAWIVFYQPGDPPSLGELERVAEIATRSTELWSSSTLGRGVLDNAILPQFVISVPAPPVFILSLDTTGFDVIVTDSVATHNPATGALYYSIDGGPFSFSLLSAQGGGVYRATLPALSCEKQIEYYVSFENSAGTYVITEPLGAPTTVFSAVALRNDSLVFSDDFETDQGWTVGATGDNATSGIWTRVSPIGTGPQPDEDHSLSGALCYITGQGSPYGSPAEWFDENDVDSGRTTLTSPNFDLSGKNGLIRYARWFSNSLGPRGGPWRNEPTDVLTVTISNDGGTTFPETLEVVQEDQVAWVTREFMASDYITTTNQMKVRLAVQDLSLASYVEAGLDDFQVFATDVSAKAGDANGSGGNPNLTDIIYLVNYIFKGGPKPDPSCRGDANASGGNPNLADIIYLVNYVFKGGPSPIKSGVCCL